MVFLRGCQEPGACWGVLCFITRQQTCVRICGQIRPFEAVVLWPGSHWGLCRHRKSRRFLFTSLFWLLPQEAGGLLTFSLENKVRREGQAWKGCWMWWKDFSPFYVYFLAVDDEIFQTDRKVEGNLQWRPTLPPPRFYKSYFAVFALSCLCLPTLLLKFHSKVYCRHQTPLAGALFTGDQ